MQSVTDDKRNATLVAAVANEELTGGLGVVRQCVKEAVSTLQRAMDMAGILLEIQQNTEWEDFSSDNFAELSLVTHKLTSRIDLLSPSNLPSIAVEEDDEETESELSEHENEAVVGAASQPPGNGPSTDIEPSTDIDMAKTQSDTETNARKICDAVSAETVQSPAADCRSPNPTEVVKHQRATRTLAESPTATRRPDHAPSRAQRTQRNSSTRVGLQETKDQIHLSQGKGRRGDDSQSGRCGRVGSPLPPPPASYTRYDDQPSIARSEDLHGPHSRVPANIPTNTWAMDFDTWAEDYAAKMERRRAEARRLQEAEDVIDGLVTQAVAIFKADEVRRGPIPLYKLCDNQCTHLVKPQDVGIMVAERVLNFQPKTLRLVHQAVRLQTDLEGLTPMMGQERFRYRDLAAQIPASIVRGILPSSFAHEVKTRTSIGWMWKAFELLTYGHDHAFYATTAPELLALVEKYLCAPIDSFGNTASPVTLPALFLVLYIVVRVAKRSESSERIQDLIHFLQGLCS